jgi:signal transduction histidine kinase
MSNQAPLRSTRLRLGFGQRVGALFGALALLLVWLGVTVSIDVAQINASQARVLEEQRESEFSRDALHALRMLRTHMAVRVGSTIDPEERATLLEYVASSAAALAELQRGPVGDDPSTAEHSGDEERLYAALASELERLRTAITQDSGAPKATLESAVHLAEVLHGEVRDEVLASSRALQTEGRRLRRAVIWTMLVALASLLAVSWMVRRFVVRPVEQLRAGAARLAAGELDHRVAVHSSDEIGELASEFNRMAADLAAMRGELEARVEQRTREFVQAARLAGLGTMAAGIAHEINNPLASIASCAEGLERKLARGSLTAEQQREYLQIIAKEAYRAHDITSRLLEFARSEGGPMVEFDVGAMMRELDVLLEHRLKKRRLKLAANCDPDLRAMRGNPAECKQVMLNLIHNAIDASPDGGLIRVACRADGEFNVLEVEDQGPGIPAAIAERIFDPFFTTKDPGHGTGLGLAIVHRIVEAHGGKVEALDTGHGALFRVRVPRNTP